MIRLTWGNLRDNEFITSMGKLYGQPMGYHLGRCFALLGREIKKQQKLCDETHESILKKYGTPDKERPGIYNLHDATRKEYAEELLKLNATDFQVRIPKFSGEDLSKIVQFSPQDLMLLEPILLAEGEAPEATEPGLKAVQVEKPSPAPAH